MTIGCRTFINCGCSRGGIEKVGDTIIGKHHLQLPTKRIYPKKDNSPFVDSSSSHPPILYYKNGFMCKYMCLTCVRHVSYTCMTCGTITNQCLDLKNLHVESNFIRDNRNMVLCANTRVLHVSYTCRSHETITNQFLDLKYPHIKSKNIRLGQETQEICYTNNGSL